MNNKEGITANENKWILKKELLHPKQGDKDCEVRSYTECEKI